MATRIDLDDLPPKLAAVLTGIATGEEVLLVQNGVVVGRLTGGAGSPQPTASSEAAPPPEENAKEIFEHYRNFDVQILRHAWGIKLEIMNAPAAAFVRATQRRGARP